MIGVIGQWVVVGVATCASIGCIVVISIVAGITIIGDGDMRTREWIHGIMVKNGGRPACFYMTLCTIG